MPELPEVENIRVQLQKYLVGHKIKNIQVNWKKTFPEGTELLLNTNVIAVQRYGKVLVIDFANEYSLAVHIKMTGQFIYRGPHLQETPILSEKVTGGVPGKHTHAIFTLDKGGMLYYNDLRKFGWMKVVKTEELKSIPLLRNMGPEPLANLSLEKFFEIIRSSPQNIKTMIMDQTKISGVGNIYANDALYLSGVHPTRKANTLSKEEGEKLFAAIEEVLRRGIKAGGASENSFVTPDGTEGSYQDIALIYGKEKTKCPKCGSIIQKVQLGGRGTYYCPRCQQ